MRYLALIYGDASGSQTGSPQAADEETRRHTVFSRREREAGKVVGGDELAPSSVATTVRIRDGKTVVTDGPYAEVKEALGGYYVLDCNSIDEACEVAAQIPTATTGAIEVRPVYEER